MDHLAPLADFSDRLVHIHAKDVTVDTDRLNDVGILATPVEFHTPVLPGRGSIDWNTFLAALGNVGYQGAVCVEVEDRDFEGSHDLRLEALRQSLQHLRNA
jgi:sugar phosphate isomerase/epimerase